MSQRIMHSQKKTNLHLQSKCVGGKKTPPGFLGQDLAAPPPGS